MDGGLSLEASGIALAFLAGTLLGAGYMAALWVAVRRLASARRPAMLLLTGALLRIALLLGAFYLVMDGRWERLLACLAGFVLVRVAATQWARRAPRAAPDR